MGDRVKKEKKSTHIGLKVKNQDENVIFFRIKKDLQFQKLMHAYCIKQDEDYGTMRFVYDGSCLRPGQTPEELKMAEGDEIDVLIDHISA